MDFNQPNDQLTMSLGGDNSRYDNTAATGYSNEYDGNPVTGIEQPDQAPIEPTKKLDFFDIAQMKSAYPKVSINLLGNLHQAKIIHVLQEGQEINE